MREHYHLAVYYEEWSVGVANYMTRESSLLAFVRISNQLFGRMNEDDTRITLEECQEALEHKPKALFVGWGLMRVTWIVCNKQPCVNPLMN